MQTVASTPPRSFATIRCAVFALLLGLCLAPSTKAASLVVSDGHQTLTTLPLGSDLYVAADGLVAGGNVEFRLVDWNGQAILQHPVSADSAGEVALSRIWLRTGIGGCDCRFLGDGYPFRDADEARLIIGQTVTVELLDAADGTLLATQRLNIVDSDGPLIFPADLKGCPKQFLPADETILLLSDGPTPAATVFVVAHRDQWSIGTPFEDVRAAYPQGQDIAASQQGWNELLWQSIESHSGHYDVLIRWQQGGGQPGTLRFGEDDTVLLLPSDGEDRTNGGLVIDDWGCGDP